MMADRPNFRSQTPEGALAEFGTIEDGAPKRSRRPDEPKFTYDPEAPACAIDRKKLLGVQPTEDAVATAFAREFAGRLVYDHTDKKWWLWEMGCWTRDLRGRVFNTLREFLRAVNETQEKPVKTLTKMSVVGAIERGVQCDPLVAGSSEMWDHETWLLGIPGGVIDLRTGALERPRPDLYIRKRTAVAPAPAGTKTPLWDAFLADATRGDAETRAFLQRLAGYLLTGEVNEEVLTFLYGLGGNGKGVFLGALATILGDYAVSVPIEVFTAGNRLNLEYYRAKMVGARLVTASETEAGAAWAESQLKELSGNETRVTARSPYGEVFEYWPQFKIVIIGNHAPKLKGRSPAMERRLRIVPFTNEPTSPDPDLKAKLRDEYPGILRWMLDGCAAWRLHRLGTAPAIQRATSQYFEAQDALGRWLGEACIRDKTLKVRPGQLFSAFVAWCKENGETLPSNVEFAEQIARVPGLERVRSKGQDWIRGIGLKAPGDPRGEE